MDNLALLKESIPSLMRFCIPWSLTWQPLFNFLYTYSVPYLKSSPQMGFIEAWNDERFSFLTTSLGKIFTRWSCQEREPFIISCPQEQLRNPYTHYKGWLHCPHIWGCELLEHNTVARLKHFMDLCQLEEVHIPECPTYVASGGVNILSVTHNGKLVC